MSDHWLGSTRNGFKVERLLGVGGMARIYLCTQQSTGRTVAMKVLPPAYTEDATARQRFEREARTLAQLHHPHILSLIDFFISDGEAFFVTPYLTHGDLDDRLARRDGPLPLAEVRRVLTQLAEALDYAHSKGVIHRDLKPGNVLLDGQGNALLSDFGVALVAEAPRLTQMGFTVGTPEYMAPEQVESRCDARSDLYSLGIIAHYMLTGRLPFKGAGPAETLLMQREKQIPDPSLLNPALSKDQMRFLSTALEKQPERRFQSGKDFANAVRAAIPEQGVVPSAGAQTQRFATEVMAVPVPKTSPEQVSLAAKLLLEPDQVRNKPLKQDEGEPAAKSSMWPWFVVGLLAGALLIWLTVGRSIGAS
jgi:serine/threonine-protein kinase